MIKYILLAFMSILLADPAFSQTDDNILWSSINIKKNLDDKNTITISPIIRHNNNLKSYQNSSIDIHFAHKLNNKWGFGLITRKWFVPDAGDRQFLWFDIRYNTSFKAIKIFSGLRYHLALDVNGNTDPDFLRWKTKFTFPSLGILTPHIAIEPWFRLNGFEQLQRVRYEPGIDIQLQSNIKLSMTYWREESKNLDLSRKFNIYVVKVIFSI